jgi:hypothetical protein
LFGDGAGQSEEQKRRKGAAFTNRQHRVVLLRKAVAVWPVALDELLATVVLTVRVAVTAAIPVMAGGAATEQEGRSTAVAGPITVSRAPSSP